MNRTSQIWLLILGLLTQMKVMGQFSGPNASTYNPNTGKYYISCLYGKNVVSLDAFGNKATFITGLKQPNNILYADLPALSGFLILDSNQVQAYDDAGAYAATLSITDAQKLQDAVYDTAIEAIYISDVNRGVIYKTTFGGPPFYIPTTVIFARPYRRPSAMILQKAKNRILYVEDTAQGNIMGMNLSNGATYLVKTLNIDSLVGLAEDGQGNLYISSQGARAIYQLNKYYAGSPKKLYSEPKPGDLFVNVAKDRWVYTCIACGTVFNPPLHVFGPGPEIMGCPKDSFKSYRNFLMKNYGTFDTGNQFIMELSNKSGSFSSVTTLASIKDSLVPDSMSGIIPGNLLAGNYKMRWRSTKPAAIGSSVVFTIASNPTIEIAASDTAQGCSNSVLVLGKNNPVDYTYQWSPAIEVDSANNPAANHTVTKKVRLYLKATNAEGCVSNDSIFILPVTQPSAGLITDTAYACQGQAVILGAEPIGGLAYSWSPGHLLNDSTIAQPAYTGGATFKFTLQVTAAGGCSSSQSQVAKTKALPVFDVLVDTVRLCNGRTMNNNIIPNKNPYTAMWIDVNNDTTYGDNKGFGFVNTAKVRVIYNDQTTGCSSEKSIVQILTPLFKPSIQQIGGQISIIDTMVQLIWFRNDTFYASDSTSIIPNKTGVYKVCAVNKYGCRECSNLINFTLNSITKNPFENLLVYPNPTSTVLYIHSKKPVAWILNNIQGQTLLNGNSTEMDVSALPNGIYLLQIGNQQPIKIIKTTL